MLLRRLTAYGMGSVILLLILVGCGGASPTRLPLQVTLSADPIYIPPGAQAMLHWQSAQATQVVSSDFGAADVTGAITVTPAATTTYHLTVSGPDGTTSASVTVTVWEGGSIAFTSHRDGNMEIYRMRTDGTNMTRITNNPATDTDPALSPDGTRLAFASDRDGNFEIYVKNADGSGVETRLTNDSADDREPRWSPDGTTLAWTREGTMDDPTERILTIPANGGAEHVALTDGHSPCWSPDGARLAFASQRDGDDNLYLVSATDGTQVTQLTHFTDPNSGVESLDWSANNQLAYAYYTITPMTTTSQIRVMASTPDAAFTTWTSTPRQHGNPRWSPGGNSLVYHADANGVYAIYLQPTVTANPVILTSGLVDDGQPVWSRRRRR